jgi:hypothetical protein
MLIRERAGRFDNRLASPSGVAECRTSSLRGRICDREFLRSNTELEFQLSQAFYETIVKIGADVPGLTEEPR